MSAAPESLPVYERVACEAAERAGAILRQRFRKPVQVETKGQHDFVTAVDREAEAAVLAVLRSHFPEHAVMAEESAPDAVLGADRLWIIDPLDGTTNFIHGLPMFGVSVALHDGTGLAAGAIHDPLREETFHAYRGGGARLNGRAIRCSQPTDPHLALIATGFPFRELSRLDRYLGAFEECVRHTAGVRRAGSACLDLAYTACGRYDGFWEIGLSRWDVAAGVLITLEAGGIVTDVTGGADYLENGDIVAAGPGIHPTLLAITRAAFA